MKKIIIILFFIVVISVSIREKDHIFIPKEAIRLRIIANSDSNYDQELKLKIKDDVEKEVYKLLENANNINEARSIINNNLDKIDNVINKYNVSYDINYGDNYFPLKYYKGIKYEAGDYESLVITLGSGLGHNWWCVLFPPLCLLDENTNLKDNEYEFYVTKLINNLK